MAYARPFLPTGLACALVSITAPLAAENLAWMDEPGFDPAEFQCLTAAIFDSVETVEADQLERAAWVLKNRASSPDFPGSYCALAGEVARPGPWTDNRGTELVRQVMRAEFGSDRYKASAAALEDYRAQVNSYRMAQAAAWMLMFEWYAEDPTEGATELNPAEDEAEDS